MLGSTGRVGNAFLKKALNDHHEVTALVRSADKINETDYLTIIEGNVLNPSIVKKAAEGVDVIVSALSTDKTTTLSESTPILIKVMQEKKINRIITVGTAGILNSRTEPERYRYESSESRRKTTRAAEEHRKMFEALSATNLDWTIVCPTYLPDGPAKGGYRISEDVLPENGSQISVGDTGEFVYQTLLKGTHMRKRVGIAY